MALAWALTPGDVFSHGKDFFSIFRIFIYAVKVIVIMQLGVVRVVCLGGQSHKKDSLLYKTKKIQ